MKILQILFNSKLPKYNKSHLDYFGGIKRFKELSLQLKNDLQSITDTVFDIVDTIEIDDFNIFPKEDGFVYTPESYESVLTKKIEFHKPDFVDYKIMIDRLNLINGIQTNKYDEVWIWGIPWLGLYESCMIGKKVHWLNSQGLQCNSRPFVIMGLSYERGVECALESFAHRAESIFFVNHKLKWSLFKRQVGTVHYPPNGTSDYDFSNTKLVKSYCDNWVNHEYKIFSLKSTIVNCKNWTDENGDCHRGYMLWWFNHLPAEILKETFRIGKM